MMKDYLVTITVKNNIFLKAMNESGFMTAASLSRESGVPPYMIGEYLNLKTTPFLKDGNLKKSILKISKILRRLPEDLFPKQHLKKALNKNKTTAELDISDVKNILEQKNPGQLLELKERDRCINLSLAELKHRERKIIEYRFGLNGKSEKTLEECGEIFGVQKERIRQIEAKSLRKLRHHSISDRIKKHIL